MKFLRIKFLALFLCVVCGVGIADSTDEQNPETQPVGGHNKSAPQVPFDDTTLNQQGQELVKKTTDTLRDFTQFSENESALKLFREKVAPSLIKDLETLARQFEANNESEKVKTLLALVEDLKLKMEEKPKLSENEPKPEAPSPQTPKLPSALQPKPQLPIQGATAYNSKGEGTRVNVLPSSTMAKKTPPLGSKATELKVNGQNISVHFLGNSKTEFDEGAPLYLVPMESPKSASKEQSPSYFAIPASEVLSLDNFGSENTRGLDRTQAMADFVATLPEAPKELVEGLRSFNRFGSEKDQQAIQNKLRDYLGKTEDSQGISPFQREVLARAVLDLEGQRLQRMTESTGNGGEQTRELLKSYEKPSESSRSLLPALNQRLSSWDQLKELERHAAQAIEHSGEEGSQLVKQLGEALGYDVPLATIPSLLKELKADDLGKVKALASHGLHTQLNPDGDLQLKREDLQKVLEDLIVRPSGEKVNDAFSAQFPSVAKEIQERDSTYNQALRAAISGDVNELNQLLQEGKLTPDEARRVLEGAVRDLIGQDKNAKHENNGQLDPATRQRLLENPITKSLRGHLGLTDEQATQTIAEQTRNLLKQPAIVAAEEYRQQRVAELLQRMKENPNLANELGTLLQTYGEAGIEAIKLLAEAQRAAQTARDDYAQEAAKASATSSKRTQAETEFDERIRLYNDKRTELERILRDPQFEQLSPREKRSFFDQNGWSQFFKELALTSSKDSREGAHLSDNLEWVSKQALPTLREAERQARAARAAPEEDPRYKLLANTERTDFPVTRNKVEYDPQTGGEIRTPSVENDGSYAEWLEEQRKRDPDGMKYLVAYRDNKQFQQGLSEAKTRAEQTGAAAEQAQLTFLAETRRNREAFYENAGFGKSAARFLEDLGDATQAAANLARAQNSPGTSTSAPQREAIDGLLKNRGGQVLAQLRSVGLTEAGARTVLASENQTSAGQTKKSDEAFAIRARELAQQGYRVGAFGIEFSDKAELGPNGFPAAINFSSIMENNFALDSLTGTNNYSRNFNAKINAAAESQAPVQLGKNIALHITDVEAYRRGLINGDFKGISLVSPEPFRRDVARHLVSLGKIERELNEYSLRPGDTYSPEMREKLTKLEEEQIRLTREIRKAGSIEVAFTQDFLSNKGLVRADMLAKGILGSLGTDQFARQQATIAASMDQEQAELRMYAGAGLSAVAIVGSLGTATPLALTLAGTAGTGYLSNLTGRVVDHQYQRFLFSQGILSEKPYFDKVDAERGALVSAGQSLITLGAGKGATVLGASPLGSRAIGSLASSAITSSNPDEFIRNSVTQFILSGAGAQNLKGVGSFNRAALYSKAFGFDYGAGVGADVVRTTLNNGQYTFSNGITLDATKDGKTFAATLGAIALNNLPASLIATARDGAQISKIQEARAGYAIARNPDVYDQMAKANPKLAEAAVRTLTSDAILTLRASSSNPKLQQALDAEATSRQSAATTSALREAQAAIDRIAPKKEPSSSNGILGRMRTAWEQAKDKFFGEKARPIDWANIPESSTKVLIQGAIERGISTKALMKLGVSNDQIQAARGKAPISEEKTTASEGAAPNARHSSSDQPPPTKSVSEPEKTIADLRERIDQGYALKDSDIEALLDAITKPNDTGIKIPSTIRLQAEDLIRKHISISLLRNKKDGINGVPTKLREVANDFGLGAYLETARTNLGIKGAPPAGDRAPDFKFPEKALSLEQLQEKARVLEQRARNQPNDGYENELKGVRLAIDYLQKNPDGAAYRVTGVDGSEVTFPNGRTGQIDKAMVVERPNGRQVEVIVESKGSALDGVNFGNKKNPKTEAEKQDAREGSQVAKYTSTGKKVVFVVTGDQPEKSLGTLKAVLGRSDDQSSLDNARGLVYLMPRAEYEKFLTSGNPSDEFARFLDSDPTDRRPETLPKLFEAEKPSKGSRPSTSATTTDPNSHSPLLNKLFSMVTDPSFKGFEDVIERVAASRGLKPEDLSVGEKDTIVKFERGVAALRAARPELTYAEAFDKLLSISELVSVDNRASQLTPKSGGKKKSLDPVVSDILIKLGPEFLERPFAERLKAAEQALRANYEIDENTGYRNVRSDGTIVETEKLLPILSEAIANIHAVDLGPRPLFRATAVDAKNFDLTNPQDLRRLVEGDWSWQRDKKGYAHAGPDKKTTESFVEGVRIKPGQIGVVYEFPPGAKGFAVNGEGPIKRNGVVAHKTNAVVPNDTGILFPGKHFEPDLSSVRIEDGKVHVRMKAIEPDSQAANPAAPRPPPIASPGPRSFAQTMGDLFSAFKRGLGFHSKVNLERAAALAPEGISPKLATEIIQAQKQVLQKAHEVPVTTGNKNAWIREKFEPSSKALAEEIAKRTGRSAEESKTLARTWARVLMDEAVLGEGAVPKSSARNYAPFETAPQMSLDQADALPIKIDVDASTKKVSFKITHEGETGKQARETLEAGLEITVDGKKVPLGSPLSNTNGAGKQEIIMTLFGQPVAKYEFDAKQGFLRDTGEYRKLSASELRRFDQEGRSYIDEWKKGAAVLASPAAYKPVIDLHTHFGGAIRPEALIERAQAREIPYPTRLLDQLGISYDRSRTIKRGADTFLPLTRDSLTPEGFKTLQKALSIDPMQVRGFIPMERIYEYRAPLVKDKDSFGHFLREAALDYQRMGVKYVESSISDVTKPDWLEEAHRVLPQIEKETGVKIRFVAGLWRHSDSAWNMDQIARIKALNSPYIVGVDFMGHETNSTRAFEDQIREAAKMKEIHPQFQIRVHAGENPLHPENVRVAIEAGATRIGHGLYGVDDDTLKLAIRKGVTIEFNQSSNMALNNISSAGNVPIKRYLDAGAKVTLGTDGHTIYHTTNAGEADAARLAGLTNADLQKIARTDQEHIQKMEQMFKSRYRGSKSLTVDASRIPAATYTPEYERNSNQERAQRIASLKASLSENVERGGIKGSINLQSSEGATTAFKGMTPIMVSGASEKSWPLISVKNQEAIKRSIEAYLSTLDPKKAYLVTGATNFGVEKIVHEVGRKMGFRILGTLVEDAKSGDVGPITDAVLMGKSWYDKTAGALGYIQENGGRVIFVGGGNILRDEIQAARNAKVPFDLMNGPEGASTDAAKLFTGNAFTGPRDLLQRTLGDHPGIAAPDLIRTNSLEALSFEPVSKKPISYEYGGEIRDSKGLKGLSKLSYAVNGVEGLKVETRTSDGKETEAVAQKGDVIMTGPNGEQYIVAAAKFPKLYQGEIGKAVIPEQGPRQVARYQGPDGRIMASFGEVMVLKNGDYVVHSGDGFYRIGKDEFEKTYNPLAGEFSRASQTQIRTALGELFKSKGQTLRGQEHFDEIISLKTNPNSDPNRIARSLTEFLKANGVYAEITAAPNSTQSQKPTFTLRLWGRKPTSFFSESGSLSEKLSSQFGLNVKDWSRGTDGETPRAPAAPLDWVTTQMRELTYVKGWETTEINGEKVLRVKSADIDNETDGFKLLPQALRTKLTSPDADGFVTITPQLRKEVETWMNQAVSQRIQNIVNLPPGSNLRILDLWSQDKNGSGGSNALIQMFDKKSTPDSEGRVAFFGPGHGNPSGTNHSLLPILVKGEPLFVTTINADKLLEAFAQMPGVKKAEVVYYRTCSAGVCSTEGDLANAERAARITGKPVIAPMGIASHGSTGKRGQRSSSVGIWKNAERKVGADGRLRGEVSGLIPADEALRIFYPDGRSEPISFQDFVAKYVDPEKKGRIGYQVERERFEGDSPAPASTAVKAVKEPHPGYLEYRNFNDGMRAALSWLSEQGYSGQLRDFKPGKFDPAGLPSSLSFRDPSGELIKIRIEVAPLRATNADGKVEPLFEGKPRAHINVSFGKKEGPHFLIPGGRAEVDATLKQLLPTFGPQETTPLKGTSSRNPEAADKAYQELTGRKPTAEERTRIAAANKAASENPQDYWGSKEQPYWRPGPNPTVDLIVTRDGAKGLEVLLIQRGPKGAEPNKWAIPGGFHDSEAGKGEFWRPGKESAEGAALRELVEETGLDASAVRTKMKKVGTYDNHGRDPRDNEEAWAVTNAFQLHLDGDLRKAKVKGMDDASKAEWVPVAELGKRDIAFDHAAILRDATLAWAEKGATRTPAMVRVGGVEQNLDEFKIAGVKNTQIAHAADRAVERGISKDKQTARAALEQLSKEIKARGFPDGTIADPKRADSVLVPFGKGWVSFELKKNGSVHMRTAVDKPGQSPQPQQK